MKSEYLSHLLAEGLSSHERLITESQPTILKIADALLACLQRGNKILLCGNGGSAADAQHVAAEIVGRYTRERKGWPAIALTTDTSILTAVGNDYGYEKIFSRQVEALAVKGDVVVGISTSGNSPNVLAALTMAQSIGCETIGFTGGSGGKMGNYCDVVFFSPTSKTPNIQELHIVAWHAICDLVELGMIEDGSKKME